MLPEPVESCVSRPGSVCGLAFPLPYKTIVHYHTNKKFDSQIVQILVSVLSKRAGVFLNKLAHFIYINKINNT